MSKPTTLEVTKVKTGLFLLGEEETSYRSVSQKVYNDPNKYQVILEANAGVLWAPGIQLVIPNRDGRVTIPQEDESSTDLIRRMFPGQPPHMYLDNYFKWNDGFEADELVGIKVFVPER